MTKKLQISSIFVLLLLFALANMAMSPIRQVVINPMSTTAPTMTMVRVKPAGTVTRPVRPPKATWTPGLPAKTRPAAGTLDLQAGNSDWIALIGILIVVIIVTPLLLKYKEWRGN